MSPKIVQWLLFRLVRWLAWITFFAYGLYFISDRSAHLNGFGQLLHSTEAVIYGSGLVAVFAGFLELMMRERAGVARPRLGEFIPPKAGAAAP